MIIKFKLNTEEIHIKFFLMFDKYITYLDD